MSNNYFADRPEFESPKGNGSIVISVAAVLIAAVLFSCGGLGAVGFLVYQNVQRDIAEFDEWNEVTTAEQNQRMSDYIMFCEQGDYDSALEVLEEELAEHPDSAVGHNNLGWLRAVCPRDEMRDGEEALEHAEFACQTTAYSNYSYVDTLAAAHAENGNFDEAVKWQTMAIELRSSGNDLEDLKDRLRLYKQGKPFREHPISDIGEAVSPQRPSLSGPALEATAAPTP